MIPEKFQYQAHGKLLLTGEYFVLDGALALAVPTKKGQIFNVNPFHAEPDILFWESINEKGEIWFEGWFSLSNLQWIEGSNEQVGRQLESLLQAALAIKSLKFPEQSIIVQTRVTFPLEWGLGSSSTMISFLGKWLGIDPYKLLQKGFGGSGYDVACAESEGAIIYQLTDEKPVSKRVDFYPDFHQNLYFVHLGKKQSSREGIRRYRKMTVVSPEALRKVSGLTQQFLNARNLPDFQEVMKKHETFIGQQLSLPVIQESFPNFPGQLKSLGAWGGDFMLAASDRPFEEIANYFQAHGLNVVVPYKEMIL